MTNQAGSADRTGTISIGCFSPGTEIRMFGTLRLVVLKAAGNQRIKLGLKDASGSMSSMQLAQLLESCRHDPV